MFTDISAFDDEHVPFHGQPWVTNCTIPEFMEKSIYNNYKEGCAHCVGFAALVWQNIVTLTRGCISIAVATRTITWFTMVATRHANSSFRSMLLVSPFAYGREHQQV